MAASSTLLCIHRDPAQLSLLRENGYELVTATNGHDGLRLFRSRPVDAVVLDYELCLLNGAVVAAEIKKANPEIPIVMLADSLELPEDALKSVDALVSTSDGPRLLWATVHSILNAQPKINTEGAGWTSGKREDTIAIAAAQEDETRLTAKDVRDAASSAGLRMSAEKAEDYLIQHCISLRYSMQACGREYVLQGLQDAFREQKQSGRVQQRKHSPFNS